LEKTPVLIEGNVKKRGTRDLHKLIINTNIPKGG
jgi:hypothetical protein